MTIEMTEFARLRLFPRDRRLTAIQDSSADEFVQALNMRSPERVIPGYASFCVLHAHRNWTSTRCSVMAITDENRQRLRTGYEARSRDELPVLVRWFAGLEPPIANFLLPILYSREQLAREGTAIAAEWGVVGCLYTMIAEEIPMVPITMMRNALGVEEGGSGVPLGHAAYHASVAFWEAHANWRA